MRLLLLLIILVPAIAGFAQKPDDPLATAKGHTFTVRDLSPEAQQIWATRDKSLSDARVTLLTRMLNQELLNAESKARGVSVESLVKAEYSKVPQPAETEIKAVYDANRAALGEMTLEQSRKQIVEFLRRDPEQKALQSYLESLAQKHKVAAGKDANSPGLKPSDVLFTAAGKSFTVQDFETANKLALYDAEMQPIDAVKADLDDVILNTLVIDEAKALNIDASAFLAREISDKIKEYTDEERAGLVNALKKKLFAKYDVKILVPEPKPVVQKISADDDPAFGSAAAPVTVVMFSDFQCPACARTHPVLKKVIAEYGGKVRYVVRDFPLENIHQNAFIAALAANAAQRQGKYVEFIEILYKNQDALDRASLVKHAANAGLNVKQFELDLASENAAAEIRKDVADGTTYGVNGTPTIFVNGIMVRHLSADAFRDAIDGALKP